MQKPIADADWRVFKKVSDVLYERACQQILAAVSQELGRTDLTAGERHQRVWKILRQHQKGLDQAFRDFRRSTAELQLAVMRRQGLLTDAELALFSPPTQERIRLWCQPREPAPPGSAAAASGDSPPA